MATTLNTNADLTPADAAKVEAIRHLPAITENNEHTFRETVANALIITRREMRDSFRDWRIMGPIVLLTLIFPLLAQGMTAVFANFFVSNGAAPLIDNFLPLLPMIVGFFPVSISLVIALETFVGEKERRSLEPLLSTPLTNTELYVGKTLAATIPPLLASYIGMGVYLVGLIFGVQHWRPEPVLIVQLLLLTTAQALVMVTGAVVVSSQTTSTRAANLLASFIIIPTSLLVMLESFIMVTNNRYVLWYIMAGLVVADIMLFGMGARIFNREELLGRTIDQINLRWAWQQFRLRLRGGPAVKSIGAWYRTAVFPVLRDLRMPAAIIVLCALALFIGGYTVARSRPDLQFPATLGDVQRQQTMTRFETLFQLSGNNLSSISFIVVQNIRALLVATILATFTFGVLGMFPAIIPFGILGFLLGQPSVAALGIGTFMAAVLPHSIIELPAAILAGAAAVRLGAIITRPPKGQGVGEAWLGALADVIKIGIGIVIPLVILASLIEVFITPRLVMLVNGG